MTDLTNAADFGVDHENSSKNVHSATNVNRWDRKGERLYINDVRGFEGGYVDLETGELHEHGFNAADVTIEDGQIVVEYTSREGLMGDVTVNTYTVVIAFDADDEDAGDETEAENDESDVDANDDTEDVETEPELMTDGGRELPSELSETIVRDRLQQYDDPEHEDANTVADVVDAWGAVQEEARAGLDQLVEYHRVVYEDRSLAVFDTGTTHDDQETVYAEAGVDDEILADILDGLMHDVARDQCDHDWGTTYPLVVTKSREQKRMESYVRQRLGQLTVERGGAARALDYWATKIQGLTFEQWSRESGRSSGAIGNSISRARRDSL